MHRHLTIAALVSALFAAPMWAQMRGGARAAAPIGRPSLASRGPVMVNRDSMMANRRAFIGSPRGARFAPNFRGQFFFRDHFFFDHFHHRHRFFFGFSPFFAGLFPWYYAYPAYYGDDSYPTGSSFSSAVYDSGNAYSAPNSELASTIGRLSDEVERLREARGSAEARQPKPEPERKSEPHESTVLVFRDKHIQEVKNYAIVGPTLWIFNEQRATKVPLPSLDLNATTKLNEERGIEFRLPN